MVLKFPILRKIYFCLFGIGVEEKLVALMRSDITQNTSGFIGVKKPVGTRSRAHPVWSEPDGLDHFADGPFLDQFSRFDGSRITQPFAVEYGIDPFRLFLHFLNFFKLAEC